MIPSLKLFVEPTTRCNLSCAMCVKQSPHADIPEGDLSMDLFDRVIPALPHAQAVILTGIGEPLLHPDLETMIRVCKRHMPETGRVGFQTNAMLIDGDRAESLVQSGVDQICISVDGVTAPGYEQMRNGGRFDQVKEAIRRLREMKKIRKSAAPEIGIEFVLTRDNVGDLSELVAWTDHFGVGFVIVTHLLPYHKRFEALAVHQNGTDEAREFIDKYLPEAAQNGIFLPNNDREYFSLWWNRMVGLKEKRAAVFLEKVRQDAREQGISLNIASLLQEDLHREQEIRECFDRMRQTALEKGIRLVLPSLRPQRDRFCRFVEENSLFISWNGSVHPCYLLWHKYACRRGGSDKYVNPLPFGSIAYTDILEIRDDPAFVNFRNAVTSYDYPHCTDCGIGPCPLITSDPFEHDCYWTEVPCGDCGWNCGLYHCLT